MAGEPHLPVRKTVLKKPLWSHDHPLIECRSERGTGRVPEHLARTPGLQEGEGLEQEEGPAVGSVFVAEALIGDDSAHQEGTIQPEEERARVVEPLQVQGQGQSQGEG